MASRKQGDYRAIIGYVNEPRGARQFIESSEQVQASLRRTETELGDLGPAAAGGVRRLGSQMDIAQREIERAGLEVRDLRAELERLDDVRVTPEIDVQTRGGGRGVGNALDSIDRVGSIGSQLASGIGSAELGNSLGLVGDLAGAFTSLNPLLAATTVVGVGVAGVFGEINRRMEEAKATGEGYAARTQGVAELATSGATSQDVKESIDTLEGARAGVINFNAGLASSVGEISSWARQIENARLQILNENQQFGSDDASLQRIRNLEEFIAGAEELQAAAIQRLADRTGGTVTSLEAANAALAANQTYIDTATTQIGDYNRALAGGVFAYNDSIQQAKDNAAAFDTLVNAGQGVLDLIQRNIDLSLEQAEATRREIVDKQKLLVITEEAAEATRRAAQATAITEATTQLFDVRADLSEKTNDLAEKEAALAKVTADAATKIAQLEADAGERRNEAIAKSNDDIEKQEQEHKERLADIDRKANANIQNAIGRRDALAAFQAAQERKEQITDEVDSNRKRKQELQKSLDDQLNAIRTNLRKQTEAVRANAANEETVKRQARDASRVALQNAQNAEVLLTKQFYTTQQNSLVTNYQQQLAIHEAGMIKIKDGIVRQYQDALQWGGGKTPSTSSRATTTINSSSRPVINAPITINGTNLQPRQVQHMINSTLMEVVERANGRGR